jgi:hydroxymethylbilane synthase
MAANSQANGNSEALASSSMQSSSSNGRRRVDLAHDTAPPTELPSISRNPSLAAAIRAIDIDSPHDANVIKIGTRASALALVQANMVLEGLQALGLPLKFQLAPMSVAGDRNKVEPLYLMGGKALWTKDLEVALVENAVDCIVHSFKDVPTTLPEGCEIAGVLEREDPRDALVVKKGRTWKTLDDLPKGSCVGSSSVRRVAQLRRAFPHLFFQDCRGNM